MLRVFWSHMMWPMPPRVTCKEVKQARCPCSLLLAMNICQSWRSSVTRVALHMARMHTQTGYTEQKVSGRSDHIRRKAHADHLAHGQEGSNMSLLAAC